MLNKRLASLFAATTSFTLLMVLGIFGASKANAVSVTSSNGVATGINDLNVDGQKYDVEFINNSFVNVFGNPMLPGWTPPNFSAFVQPSSANSAIQQATNAVVNLLNAPSNNTVAVADASSNPLVQTNYFITGGLVDRGPDTVQVFYGQLINNQWASNNFTCTYDLGKSGDPSFCLTAISSNLGINISTPQSPLMFAKYTNKPAPEPITILGTVVAGGMGIAIKRKQKNKTAA